MILSNLSLLAGGAGPQVVRVSPGSLAPWPGHPFQVRDDDDMRALRESVARTGVREPILARRTADGTLQIVSGHRRAHAAKAEGLADVPVIVLDIGDDDATMLMDEANLTTRQSLLPSERARAYRTWMQAASHQGKAGGDTREDIGAATGQSGRTVARWAKAGGLPDATLDAMDRGQLRLDAALLLADNPDAARRAGEWLAADPKRRLSTADARRLAATDGDTPGDTPAPRRRAAGYRIPAEWVPGGVRARGHGGTMEWIRQALVAAAREEGQDDGE